MYVYTLRLPQSKRSQVAHCWHIALQSLQASKFYQLTNFIKLCYTPMPSSPDKSQNETKVSIFQQVNWSSVPIHFSRPNHRLENISAMKQTRPFSGPFRCKRRGALLSNLRLPMADWCLEAICHISVDFLQLLRLNDLHVCMGLSAFLMICPAFTTC